MTRLRPLIAIAVFAGLLALAFTRSGSASESDTAWESVEQMDKSMVNSRSVVDACSRFIAAYPEDHRVQDASQTIERVMSQLQGIPALVRAKGIELDNGTVMNVPQEAVSGRKVDMKRQISGFMVPHKARDLPSGGTLEARTAAIPAVRPGMSLRGVTKFLGASDDTLEQADVQDYQEVLFYALKDKKVAVLWFDRDDQLISLHIASAIDQHKTPSPGDVSPARDVPPDGQGSRSGAKQRRLLNVRTIDSFEVSPFRDPTFCVSDDGRHVARGSKLKDAWAVILDGQQQRAYAMVLRGLVKVDPQPTWAPTLIVRLEGRPIFSPDSERFAYPAKANDGKWFAVVDGQEQAKYDSVPCTTLCFSPDSKRLAYVAILNGKMTVVRDGKEGPWYEGIGVPGPIFSPDSRRLAYTAVKSKAQFVVVDGEEGPEYNSIQLNSVTFSPDSRHVAYSASRDSKGFIVIDGNEMGPYKAPGWVSFGPNGEHLAYEVGVTGGNAFVVDGQQGRTFEGIVGDDHGPAFWFDASGHRFAYIGASSGKQVLVVDGVEIAAHEGFAGVCFSPDGHRLAYIAGQGKKLFAVIDGRQSPEYDRLPRDLFCFSPDSRSLAYMARRGTTWRAVLNGEEDPAFDYDGIVGNLSFTPDSTQIVYGAGKGQDRFVVVGRTVGPHFDDIVTYGGRTVYFDTPGKFHYFATLERSLLLVEEALE